MLKPRLAHELTWLDGGLQIARDLRVPDDLLRVDREDRTVLVERIWLEVPIDDTWMTASRLAVQDGRVVIAEIRVFPLESRGSAVPPAGIWSAEVLGARAPVPPKGLSARTLRNIRLGEHPRHVADVLDWVTQQQQAAPAHVAKFFGLGAVTQKPQAIKSTRPRSGRPDAFYAAVAARYLRAIKRNSKRPGVDVARQMKVEPSKIRDWLHQARERKLLSPSSHGKRGGQLTRAGAALVKQRHRLTTKGRSR
jgi:transposase-like protein